MELLNTELQDRLFKEQAPLPKPLPQFQIEQDTFVDKAK